MAFTIGFPKQTLINEKMLVQWTPTGQSSASNGRTKMYTNVAGGGVNYARIYSDTPKLVDGVYRVELPVANVTDKLGKHFLKLIYVKYDGITGNTTDLATEFAEYTVVDSLEPVDPADFIVTQADLDVMAAGRVAASTNGVNWSVGTELKVGDEIKLTVQSGYEINYASLSYGEGQSERFVVSEDLKTATLVLPAGGNYGFTVDSSVIDTSYKLQSGDISALNTSRHTTTLNGVKAFLGQSMPVGSVFVMTPASGWRLDSAGGTSFDSGDEFILRFRASGDNLTATTDKELEQGSYITWDITETQITPNVEASFNKIYKVTDGVMELVNKARFVIEDIGSADFPTFESVDYGGQILSLLSLPFEIDPSYVLENESIQLGKLNTRVQAPKINDDNITLDLGSIVVPAATDSTGYVGVTALLYLPRLDPIALDLENVIGQTVGVKYVIDVYSGRATVNISSTKTGGVITTKSVDMGFNIPYINEQGQSIDNSNIDVGGDNGITRARIDLVKTDLILAKGFWTIPVVDEGKLDGYTGFVEYEHVRLDFKAPLAEKALLESKLNNGVIINA